MATSASKCAGRITSFWLADRFAEIEMKDMRVTEVRLRELPEILRGCCDVVRGKKHIWNARLFEDRTMRAGVVQFRYEKVVEEKVVTRIYSRSRCFACGQTVPVQ